MNRQKNRITLALAVSLAVSAQAAEVIPASPELFSTKQMATHSEVVLREVRSRTLPNGKTLTRYQQTYQGIPVWGQAVVRSNEGLAAKAYGDVLQGVGTDVPSTSPAIKASDALNLAMTQVVTQRSMEGVAHHLGSVSALKLAAKNQTQKLYIYLDEQDEAHLAYLINWVENGDQPARPFVFIDAHSGEVLKQWEGLAHQDATGPGGNEKTGRYEYGTDYPALQVDADCRMTTDKVETLDMQNQTQGGEIFSFTCPYNDQRYINGAYSPLNDAHFFGGVVYDMYNDWYGMAPLTQKMRVRVHYGNSYQNAFWDGEQITLGDGADKLYPLVSLDVVSHEVSHGFTEQNSNLWYTQQPGGINESFSDMAGEAAEFYLEGENDWMAGAGIFKGEGSMRYLDEPTRDGVSISHTINYHHEMDVHWSSGLFNRAFYLIANSDGWDTRKAFDVFVLANQMFWHETSGFLNAACGAVFSAEELGYGTAPVVEAFNDVGISTNRCTGGDPYYGGALENGVTLNVMGALGEEVYYTLPVGEGASDLVIELVGGKGDADLYVKFGGVPTTSDYDCRADAFGTWERCSFDAPSKGTYYVMVYGSLAYANASLTATFTEGVAEPASGSEPDLSAFWGQWLYFPIEVPAGMSSLDVGLKGGFGNADLYLSRGTKPTRSDYDCYSHGFGNKESCHITTPAADTWYVGVRAKWFFWGVTMDWSYQ